MARALSRVDARTNRASLDLLYSFIDTRFTCCRNFPEPFAEPHVGASKKVGLQCSVDQGNPAQRNKICAKELGFAAATARA